MKSFVAASRLFLDKRIEKTVGILIISNPTKTPGIVFDIETAYIPKRENERNNDNSLYFFEKLKYNKLINTAPNVNNKMKNSENGFKENKLNNE
jgi:hypothetical protein